MESSDTGTTVVDRPSLMDCSGHFGAGLSLSHVPMWMWAGSTTPAGMPDNSITTLVLLLPSGDRIAVPVCPELFSALSLTVTSPTAHAVLADTPASSRIKSRLDM